MRPFRRPPVFLPHVASRLPKHGDETRIAEWISQIARNALGDDPDGTSETPDDAPAARQDPSARVAPRRPAPGGRVPVDGRRRPRVGRR